MVGEGRRLRELSVGVFLGDDVDSGSFDVRVPVLGPLHHSLGLRVDRLVLRSLDVVSGVPFEPPLLQQNISALHLGISPSFDSQSPTGGVLLVAG